MYSRVALKDTLARIYTHFVVFFVHLSTVWQDCYKVVSIIQHKNLVLFFMSLYLYFPENQNRKDICCKGNFILQ